jgi:UDP-N-acetylmuramate dehydrogenase
MAELQQFIENINNQIEFAGGLRYNEPMALHTTFKVGGPADVWVRPEKQVPEYASFLLRSAKAEGIPVFILGGGANLVVSDKGFRGIVLDTGGWQGWEWTDSGFAVRSGTQVAAAAVAAAEHGLRGLEFLAGMPGSIGGAVWMNARCYETSVSDVLQEIEILDEQFNRTRIPYAPEDYGYKKSPFQHRNVLILSAAFRMNKGNQTEIQEKMAVFLRDREAKGHYRFPSAGSAFKNNRRFGKPAGKIIDELGLRGYACGGAQVAPWHGNLIINTGNARAADIRRLVEEIRDTVQQRLGLNIEPEILFVGEL